MIMEVLAAPHQYQSPYGMLGLGSSKVRDWTTTLTAPLMSATALSANSGGGGGGGAGNNNNSSSMSGVAINRHPYMLHHSSSSSSSGGGFSSNSSNSSNSNNKFKHSIMKSKSSSSANNGSISGSGNLKQQRRYDSAAPVTITVAAPTAAPLGDSQRYNNDLFVCDTAADDDDGSSALTLDSDAVQQLSARLLDELRAAKRRHLLTCTEVSLPCDLTPRIAAEILRVSEREPCGLRGCTIYIEFEDEPNNSRRIASLKIAAETVSTFEVYLTLRQDRRGWTSLLPQFMKSLARTITISPEFTITKNKLYAAASQSQSHPQLNRSSSSISYSRPRAASAATATATATT